MTSIFEINHCRVRARRSRQEIEWSWAKAKIPLERLSRLSVDELPLNDCEMLHVFAQRLTTYRGRLAILLSLLAAEVPELGPSLGDIEGQRLYVAFAHLLERDSELSEQDRYSQLLDGLAFCPVTRHLESLPCTAQTLISMHHCVPYLIQLHEQLETEALALKPFLHVDVVEDGEVSANSGLMCRGILTKCKKEEPHKGCGSE